MNPCFGEVPKEATSSGMLELAEKAGPGLADAFCQLPLEYFQQNGCQLRAPGGLGNPSEAGERPNGEPAPKEPFLKKERR